MVPSEIEGVSPAGRTPPPGSSDGQGRAALLLAESLLHALAETGRLTTEEIISVAEGAYEVAAELAKSEDVTSDEAAKALRILQELVDSLHRDLNH
jgi:hypothetical protein